MPAASPAAEARLKLDGGLLRQHTARGPVVSGAYLAGFYSPSSLRGAQYIPRSDDDQPLAPGLVSHGFSVRHVVLHADRPVRPVPAA